MLTLTVWLSGQAPKPSAGRLAPPTLLKPARLEAKSSHEPVAKVRLGPLNCIALALLLFHFLLRIQPPTAAAAAVKPVVEKALVEASPPGTLRKMPSLWISSVSCFPLFPHRSCPAGYDVRELRADAPHGASTNRGADAGMCLSSVFWRYCCVYWHD